MNEIRKDNIKNDKVTTKKKPRFVIIREYVGSRSMQESFEKMLESRACNQFDQWISM